MKIKIMGLPRSCTNYVENLMKKNFSVQLFINKHGYKHGFQVKGNHNILLCLKNPYAWLTSFHRLYGENITFKDFIQQPWILRGREFSYPILYWNEFNTHWLPKSKAIAKHENLIENLEKTLQQLESELGLKRKGEIVDMQGWANHRGGDSGKSFDASYYTKKKYLEEYDHQSLEFTNNHLDQNLMSKLRYIKET